jgi:hypothetical protein
MKIPGVTPKVQHVVIKVSFVIINIMVALYFGHLSSEFVQWCSLGSPPVRAVRLLPESDSSEPYIETQQGEIYWVEPPYERDSQASPPYCSSEPLTWQPISKDQLPPRYYDSRLDEIFLPPGIPIGLDYNGINGTVSYALLIDGSVWMLDFDSKSDLDMFEVFYYALLYPPILGISGLVMSLVILKMHASELKESGSYPGILVSSLFGFVTGFVAIYLLRYVYYSAWSLAPAVLQGVAMVVGGALISILVRRYGGRAAAIKAA